MADMTAQHLGDGICWCSNGLEHLHEPALDRIYPDRCQIPNSADDPAPGERRCVLVAGHAPPCRGSLERPGDPCHFCGQRFDGDACPQCWTNLEGMALADIKALFAESCDDLSIDPEVSRG